MPPPDNSLSLPGRNRRRIALSVAGAAAAAFLLLWLWRAQPPPEFAGPGSPAPALELADLSGKPVSLLQYRGQVVLVDFWATWCDACIEELPDLKRLYASLHGQGFEILAASLDQAGRRVLVPFAAQHKPPWQVLVGNDEILRSYAVFGLPTKYLIDQNGMIANRYSGWVNAEKLRQDIQALLNKETRKS